MGSSEGFIHTGLSLKKTAEEVKEYLKEPSTIHSFGLILRTYRDAVFPFDM